MAELRLNSEMNLLSTRYRVRSDCACRFKRQKWMVEVLRETSSDIGRIGPKGHERELLLTLLDVAVVVRHPDGSFTCNRERFPTVANLLGCTVSAFSRAWCCSRR